MNHGIYGEYNVEVIKSGSNESYYPFGTGYQKNLILDEFLGRILSGWSHNLQPLLQTCITNTGSNPPTRFDTTGTFKYGNGPAFNDITYASTALNAGVVISENRLWLSRDFIFNTVTNPNGITYREAMVGLFFKSAANYNTSVEPDIALSHFVFPNDILVNFGDRLKINYTVNFIIDYLSQTGSPIILNGNGYNFDGKIYLKSNDVGLFGYMDNTFIHLSYNAFNGNIGYSWYKSISSNANSYVNNTSALYPGSHNIFGTQLYNGNGFFGQAFTTGTYPTSARAGTIAISGAAATLSRNNFQIDDNGASVDMSYYFSPSATQRDNISGILLSRYSEEGWNRNAYGLIYLLFNQPQNILANESISMKLRWSIKRL
jgi:hypothetical protein